LGRDEMENKQCIKCDVHSCKHCDCDCNCCTLKEIKVCNCNSANDKEATMCDSYKEKTNEN
jgi:hypothetical protein